MARHRIGLVGTGGIAHRHIAGYREVLADRAEVVAACDLRPDVLSAYCDQYGIKHRFSDPAQLMASGEIDIAVDLTPPSAREAVFEPALAHGVHLLVEKPFARSGADAVSCVKAAAAAGCALAVNQNLRCFPEIEHTHAFLDDSPFGAIRFIKHDHFQNRPLAPGVWRAAEQHLELAIFGVHILDRVQWLARSNPKAVAAVTFRDPHGSLPGEQFASMLIQFEDGIVGQLTSNWLSKALPESHLRIDADRGSVTVRRPNALSGDATWAAAAEDAEPDIREFVDDGHFTRSFGLSMGSLLDGIEHGVEPRNSGRDNLKTMGIMHAAYLSASRGGTLVTVEEALGEPLPAPGR